MEYSYLKKNIFAEDFPIFMKTFSNDELEVLMSNLTNKFRRREENKAKHDEKPKSGLLLTDFLANVNISPRLRNILNKTWNDGIYYTLNDITLPNFFGIKNTGIKSWIELMDAVSDIIKNKKFEQENENLLKQFSSGGKGMQRIPGNRGLYLQ